MRFRTRVCEVFSLSFERVVSIFDIVLDKRTVARGDIGLRVVNSLICLLGGNLLLLVNRLALSTLVLRLHVLCHILLTARD